MATKTMEETEVETGKVSPEQFLEGLNVDLANEYSAVIL